MSNVDPARLARMKKAARRYMSSRSFEENFLKTWEIFKKAAEPAPDSSFADSVWPLAS